MACVMPFYWASDRVEDGVRVASYRHLWPLAKFEAGRDASELRVLSLWPGRRAKPIERNYAPFWTLYRVRRTGVGSEHETLWGLWRLRRGEDRARRFSLFPLVEVNRDEEDSEVSILKGLAAWGKTGRTKHRRVLWFIRWNN